MARQVDEVERSSKRNEILDCAQRLVYSIGYEQMSIQDILSQLGISKGAFYHYFDSKPALLEALIKRTSMQAEEILLPIVDNPDIPALEKLGIFFNAINHWKFNQKTYMLEILKVWYADENAIVREKLMKDSAKMVSALLNRIIRQGIDEEIFSIRHPEMAGLIFFSLMTQMSDSVGHILLKATTTPMVDAQSDLEKMMAVVDAFMDAIERVLGAPAGSVHLINREMLAKWIPGVTIEKTATDLILTKDLTLEKENLV